jgi:carboxylesterase type B
MKLSALFFTSAALAAPAPQAHDVHNSNVTYTGFYANEVEGFVGIRFAKDTSGEHRFKPPRPYTPTANSVFAATNAGPACPQQTCDKPDGYCKGSLFPNFIHEISEDCLRLNVWRPNGTKAGDGLAVLAYIYGGEFVAFRGD